MPRMAAAGSRLYPHDSSALTIFAFSSLSSFSFIVVGVSGASSREKASCSGWSLSQSYFLTASSITLTSSRTFPGQGYASSLCLALLLSLRLSSKCSIKNVAIGTMSVTVSLSGGILTTSSQMQSRKCCVIKPSLTSSSGDFAEVCKFRSQGTAHFGVMVPLISVVGFFISLRWYRSVPKRSLSFFINGDFACMVPSDLSFTNGSFRSSGTACGS